jgi:dTDP-4-dehydrorhamnose reductase
MTLQALIAGREDEVACAVQAQCHALVWHALALGRPRLDLVQPARLGPVVAAARPDLVVNAAPYTPVDRAEDEPEAAVGGGRDGAASLAATANDLGAPFIHFSTDYAFGGAKGTPWREDDPVAPLGAYGRSKLEGEWALLAAHSRSVVIRTSWLFSATGHNFVRTMLRLPMKRDEIAVVADQRGAPTFADDLAAAVPPIAPRLFRPSPPSEAFGISHFAGAPETTWHDFARAILDGAARHGRPRLQLRAILTVAFPTRAQRPADSRLDCRRIAAVHGIGMSDCRPSLDCGLYALLAGPEAIATQSRRAHPLPRSLPSRTRSKDHPT